MKTPSTVTIGDIPTELHQLFSGKPWDELVAFTVLHGVCWRRRDKKSAPSAKSTPVSLCNSARLVLISAPPTKKVLFTDKPTFYLYNIKGLQHEIGWYKKTFTHQERYQQQDTKINLWWLRSGRLWYSYRTNEGNTSSVVLSGNTEYLSG